MNESFNKLNPWKFANYKPGKLHSRLVFGELVDNLANEFIITITGSRQVGKSSLMEMLINHLLNGDISPDNITYFNLDDYSLHEVFTDTSSFISFVNPSDNNIKYIFIDEVQRLHNAGLLLKSLYDLKLNIKFICSGSSQLEIKSNIKEHLVGRSRNFEIQRLNFDESKGFTNNITNKQLFNNHLIYGAYPKVMLEADHKQKQLLLRDIYNSYVQKDIIEFLNVDNPTIFNKLITLLAGQIGNLLNIDNICNTLKLARSKVVKYIEILEATYIIKLVYPYYKNYPKEITKTPKIYFLDLGLRNYALNNFNDLELRQDKGELFENFYYLELYSNDVYQLKTINYWRTTNQTEIDFIVQEGTITKAVEAKLSSTAKPKSFNTFAEYYPDSVSELVTSKSYI